MQVPPYFDQLIEAYHHGAAQRSVHLGYWPGSEQHGSKQHSDDGDFGAAQARLDQLMVELAGVADGQSVLDIGCGFGGTLARINDSRQEMQLAGINIDPRQIDICRGISGRAGNALAWHIADATALPFGDAAFDRVLCIEAMFHFSSRRKLFAEAARVLKPGGLMAGTDILISPAAQSASVPIEAILQAGFGPWPDVWSTDADHVALARAAGLAGEVRDISAEIAPSHRHTSPPGADPGDRRAPAPLRASAALRWLQDRGWLRYVSFRFEKPMHPVAQP